MSLSINPAIVPPLDPDFVPAVLWNRAYKEKVAADPGRRSCRIRLEQPGGAAERVELELLAADHADAALTVTYVERLVKFLLWSRGGNRLVVGGADDVADALRAVYARDGERAFDVEFLGDKIYGGGFTVDVAPYDDVAESAAVGLPLGRNTGGNRIGFDLGGSDRKAAAVVDGEVVYSEEIPWDPYFENDPEYHISGIQESLRNAAAHLPKVDAIGGSAAGVYVQNEVRAASLFREISDADFEARIRRVFFDLGEEWGVPFEVVNDGEVTALAASMSLDVNAVLGVSMGTSEATGYVDTDGHITPWLNELAFAPVDYRDQGPVDEWSGDAGCGVQFFSQQGVARLVPAAGIEVPEGMPFPEQLVQVQELMAQGDDRARRLYESIGVCFGYAIAHYRSFYDFEHLLILGRVTSGRGGEIILEEARRVLNEEFPEWSNAIALHTPNEKDKRHGQAIAAASLPSVG